MTSDSAPAKIPLSEVQKHSTAQDCWVVIHGSVYNLTPFLSEHPGGAHVIIKQAGTDATVAFSQVHPPDIIEQQLPKELCLGPVDISSGDTSQTAVAAGLSASVAQIKRNKIPPLDAVFNLFDFEAIARQTLSKEAWAYYSSGAEDELTMQENHAAFHRIWLRPRVLVNVRDVCTRTTMLGQPASLPIYITATALGKLGHPEGEVVLTRAAGSKGIIQMIPTLSSCSFDEQIRARASGQVQFFQLYVNGDRKVTESIICKAEKSGIKGLFITVDAPQLGRREKDMRVKFIDDAPEVVDKSKVMRSQGAARAISQFIDPSLSWSDIPWFKSITSMPIVIKGIQTGEDAVLAARAGVAGIVVSNHGGRQLDTVRSSIEILEEVVDTLERHNLQGKLEIYVDGGFRRGSDIFKALALGARGVGLGRPFLYAMSGYGQEGVEHAIDILRDELEMVMRLIGVTSISKIARSSIITKSLSLHVGTPICDSLATQIYEPLQSLRIPKNDEESTPIKSKL